MAMVSELDLRRFRADHPPAVLLGGLNVARAAGLSGIPVIVAAAEADSLAFRSRFCAGSVLLPPLEQPVAVAEKLLRLGERLSNALGRAVPIFYGNDDYLNLLLQNRGRLAQYFRFILNDPQVATALLDKDRFDSFTRERDLPVPQCLEWEDLEAMRGPVLVKPRLKLAWEKTEIYLRLFGGAGKARVFSDGPAVLAQPLARALKDQLLFQEYIPGDDRNIWSFHGYADEKSNVLIWFIGRKLRTYPALTGVSTYLELAHHDELAAVGHRIVARLPLKGVFKVDFKQDPRSGRWFMLEVNARFNLWHYLGVRNGVSIPLAAYEYLLHSARAPAPAHFTTTYRWQSFRLDYKAYRDLASRGQLGFWGWLHSIACSRKVHDVFMWSDPVPFIVECLRRLRRFPRFTARLTRWLFTAS